MGEWLKDVSTHMWEQRMEMIYLAVKDFETAQRRRVVDVVYWLEKGTTLPADPLSTIAEYTMWIPGDAYWNRFEEWDDHLQAVEHLKVQAEQASKREAKKNKKKSE
eukprot:NODE_13850_length_464_cov_49.401760_g13556_i0.p1 GENE.NODE_13850_length_464_cov_49.401760_g13556_i0~~NODE_13850_length_464_cov_49.401760_g13556_i0.p1  ORF type:complete len:106 (-),score=19.96 NODE_13850_length_464_cov_49.401760_g13556_i0:46-363(-)